jgi:hypothetical protein
VNFSVFALRFFCSWSLSCFYLFFFECLHTAYIYIYIILQVGHWYLFTRRFKTHAQCVNRTLVGRRSLSVFIRVSIEAHFPAAETNWQRRRSLSSRGREKEAFQEKELKTRLRGRDWTKNYALTVCTTSQT